jgi:hypothetical protein
MLYEKAIETNPNLGPAYIDLAEILPGGDMANIAGRQWPAQLLYARAIELQPHEANARVKLAVLLGPDDKVQISGHLLDRCQLCLQAISSNPGCAMAYMNLGGFLSDSMQALLPNGTRVGREELLRIARQLDPQCVPGLLSPESPIADKSVESAAGDLVESFQITIDKTRGGKLGIKGMWQHGRLVLRSVDGGLVDSWNKEHTGTIREVRPGDSVVEVNGIRLDNNKIDAELTKRQKLHITLERPVSITQASATATQAPATEIRYLPRFLQGVDVIAALEEPGKFAVNNLLLKAQTRGIGYRMSMNMQDFDPDESRTAQWGTIVKGEIVGDWLQVHLDTNQAPAPTYAPRDFGGA